MKHIYTTHMKALFLLIMFFLTQSASLFAQAKFALFEPTTYMKKLIFHTTDGIFYCGIFNTAEFPNNSFKIQIADEDGIWGDYLDVDADLILDNRITQVNSYLNPSLTLQGKFHKFSTVFSF